MFTDELATYQNRNYKFKNLFAISNVLNNTNKQNFSFAKKNEKREKIINKRKMKHYTYTTNSQTQK